MRFLSNCAGAALAGALLASCSGHEFAPAPAVGPAVRSAATSQGHETILHFFKGGKDGEYPDFQVPVLANGVLYGTTLYGGASTCAVENSPAGCGTVFRVETSGSGYAVLHRFAADGTEGNSVYAGLSVTGDTLYGTTQWGGGQGDSNSQCSADDGCGTVFELSTSGKTYKTLNKFDATDGMNIRPGVVDSGGTLYGAASGDGTGSSSCGENSNSGCGLVYSLKDGKETVLHAFSGPDGYGPFFNPIAVNGTLYGTTGFGGSNSPDCVSNGGGGCGVVYAVSTSGQNYRVLHRFTGGKDGYAPWSVTEANGTLYGVAAFGGNLGCTTNGGTGCGMIFALSTSGKSFRTLYRFTGKSDGWFPNPLTVNGKNLLVSTEIGGDAATCGGSGCGTVDQLSTSGNDLKVLYQFKGGSADGSLPNAVFEQDGKIYGTTYWGGGSGCGGNGCGSIFELTP
jgi:uncharacterized repeat protein (TIGR03803 family)